MEIASAAYLRELPTHGHLELPDDTKDEFQHHLFAFMREEYDHGSSTRTLLWPPAGRIEEWNLNTADGSDLARLWVINRDSALHLALAAEHEPRDVEVELWERGITAALNRMGNRESVDWLAIIEQKQMPDHGPSSQKLDSATTVNGLSFDLAADGFISDVPVYFPGSGKAMGQYPHWPIKITGSAECFHWEADGQWQTSVRLREIIALLSLAWGGYWTLREGPRDPRFSWANTEGPLTGHSSRELPEESLLALGATPVTVPTWLAHAEATLLKKPRLRHALFAHHDGLAFRSDHSSMALLAFVSAIEATAQVTKKPQRCPECKMTLGSRDRFDTAVRSVLSEDSAALLADAYKKRSLTAHQARMHGTELRANSWGLMSTFVPDSEFVFTMGTVHAAQEASQKLLLQHLVPTSS
ncbi:hypothetical protein ACQP1W_22100 [Spirillospora sp. CA-255316]